MQPNALRHAMYFGLLLGLVFSLNFFLTTLNGAVWSMISWIIILLIPYLVYLLTVDCRKRACDGTMKYGVAWAYGIQLFFYASLVSAAFKLLYFKYLNPDFLASTLEESLQLMEQMKLTLPDEEVEQLRNVMTPINMSLNFVWLDLFAGLFVSLITAAFARKTENKD